MARNPKVFSVLPILASAALLLAGCDGGLAGFRGLGDPADDPESPATIRDTDKDGVPDGYEDRNQDGKVDPGETDPRLEDTDGNGIPDRNEVQVLACGKINDRPITVFDAPGAASRLLVDAEVRDFAVLRNSQGLAPGLIVADPTLDVAAVVLKKVSAPNVATPSAQRDFERRGSILQLGTIESFLTRSFTTVEGYPAEQATFRIQSRTDTDARRAVGLLASSILDDTTLTGALPMAGRTGRSLVLKLLTVYRRASEVVMVAAVAIDPEPAEARMLRLEEFTDGTNVARWGSFTRHVCDPFDAKASSKADIIFVVDDSGSMADDQEAVRSAASAMTDILRTANLDFRLGVTRTLAQDRNSNRRGRLEGDGLTSDLAQFQRDILVGADGGWEPGLETGLLALDGLLPRTPAGQAENANRLREGAGTVVVHLSDERDQTVECAACGACDAEEGEPTFCTDPAAQPVISDFIDRYIARGATTFAIVGDLPNGCLQAGANAEDNFEPGQGYVEVANATGGQFGSLCGNMRENLENVARVATGVASIYELSAIPASATLKVAIGPLGQGRVIPRSRTNGFDYDPVQNKVVFYGDARPQDGYEVVIAYRRWDYANNPGTPDDGCDRCPGDATCRPASDLVECDRTCGQEICGVETVCLPDYGRCGDPSEIIPPTSSCGDCGPTQACNERDNSCVTPCESTGCGAGYICNSISHLCEIPDF